ncbi:metal ABC transporter solute-binding protein, Zn/Mn family [Faecalicatena contorta]|uniref:Manganese/zinc/iron transport system substrate-binding protein n=1 Tax=Faecalicatena contorta TaxID=39482 RepID=A0A315ZX34_9FIRM|nr:zinc ABC transporter substrate-binding protein [Faecalicatena contorta]PWJ50105.1 manganese/zinc/iron transport system substrate-binding protein [Faecalicatena contorta]SUQ14226.1 manganese/zinc/iron transport system substrate-binding protein [Faecalicatena contorta]
MKQKIKRLFSAVLSLSLLLAGCSAPAADTGSTEDKLNVVTTTTMLADLSTVIGGGRVTVDGLMGPGIDPHLYQASEGDVSLMQKADIVVYNGLHLEGKMGEIFENLSGQEANVICIEDGLDESKLLASEDDSSAHDPHIWFDVSLWKEAAKAVSDGLSKADPDGKEEYETNLESYLKELDETDTYIRNRAAELPEAQRVLVTAHDAFQYFGKAYGFEVHGLQGISTDAEAGTADVSALADFIVERKIKAIFVESSVPPKTIEALQAAVKAKNFDVAIGGELYSDSLGDAEAGTDTYILTVKANIDTIVDALK